MVDSVTSYPEDIPPETVSPLKEQDTRRPPSHSSMAEKLTDIELDSIQLCETKPRSLARDNSMTTAWQEDDIETAMGTLHVSVQGDRSKPAVMTYHDIGLNGTTCFQGFFSYNDMQPILRHFCVYHVNAPGQHEGCLPLPQGLGFTGDPQMMNEYQYPTMDQLAEMLLPVLQFYGIKTVIGFGVGAGANILARFGLSHPERVDALVLVNCTSEKAGWTEWGYQKWNSWYLKSGAMTASVEEYLLWHWFGMNTMMTNHDLMTVYCDYVKSINPQNLAHFIESYIKRTDLGIVREISHLKKSQAKNFRCPVMLVAGDNSPHLDSTVSMNARLDPANSTWMKFECGGMVLEEAPAKLSDAFRLFLQGMGYVPSLSKMNLKMSQTYLPSSQSGSGQSLLVRHHHIGGHDPVTV